MTNSNDYLWETRKYSNGKKTWNGPACTHTYVYGCLSKLSVLLKILNLEKTNSSRYIVQSS